MFEYRRRLFKRASFSNHAFPTTFERGEGSLLAGVDLIGETRRLSVGRRFSRTTHRMCCTLRSHALMGSCVDWTMSSGSARQKRPHDFRRGLSGREFSSASASRLRSGPVAPRRVAISQVHPTFSAATVMMTNFRQSPLDREVFAPFCYVELRCIDDPRHLLEVEPSAEGEISSHRWAEGRADPFARFRLRSPRSLGAIKSSEGPQIPFTTAFRETASSKIALGERAARRAPAARAS